MRVKCFAQEHNTMTRPGLEPVPLDPESSALTTRPPRLPRRVVENSKGVGKGLNSTTILKIVGSITRISRGVGEEGPPQGCKNDLKLQKNDEKQPAVGALSPRFFP